jgi:hypothetical protein
MADWTEGEADELGAAAEIAVAPRHPDGSLRPFATIWIVRTAAGLYVRSWRGPSGHWLTAACQTRSGRVVVGGVERDITFEDSDANRYSIDAAYRNKYGNSSYVDAMVSDGAAATTLRLVPASSDSKPTERNDHARSSAPRPWRRAR